MVVAGACKIRTVPGYFRALAAYRAIQRFQDEVLEEMEDPMTEYYGAGDVVRDSWRKRELRILRRYGFRTEGDYCRVLFQDE